MPGLPNQQSKPLKILTFQFKGTHFLYFVLTRVFENWTLFIVQFLVGLVKGTISDSLGLC